MLKEKIEVLNIANDDVLKISAMKTNLKTDYHKLKRPADLKAEYQKKLVAVDTELDGATTFLTNQYEDFNDYKATHDTTLPRDTAVNMIQEEIDKVKSLIKNTVDKQQKIALKNKLTELKGQKSDTKVLYSRTLKNKTYLIISLSVMFILMLAALLTAFLYVQPNLIQKTGGIAVVVITCLCMVMMVIYLGYILKKEVKKWALDRDKPTLSVFLHSIWIFFFDSMGLGAFAVITSVFKKTGVFNDDKKIPGTLNVTRVVASFFGGSLTLAVVTMDIWTLIIFLIAVMVGSFVGTTIVSKIKRKPLTLTMGTILAVCAILMLLSMGRIGVLPAGSKTGLLGKGDEYLMVIGAIVFVGIGMLQAFGIGIYAPTMIVIVLLGMNFAVSAPVMMLAAALSAQVNAYTGMRKNNHLPKTSWTMIFGSVVGVFLYFMIIWVGIKSAIGNDGYAYIKEALQWISIPVIAYSAFLLLKTYWKLRKIPTPPKQKPLTLVEFKTKSYLVQTKINYEKENQKLKYQEIHW